MLPFGCGFPSSHMGAALAFLAKGVHEIDDVGGGQAALGRFNGVASSLALYELSGLARIYHETLRGWKSPALRSSMAPANSIRHR